jgi:hypothetical protein
MFQVKRQKDHGFVADLTQNQQKLALNNQDSSK